MAEEEEEPEVGAGDEESPESAERFTGWNRGTFGALNASGKKLAPDSLISRWIAMEDDGRRRDEKIPEPDRLPGHDLMLVDCS